MHVLVSDLDQRRPPLKSILRTTNLLERLFLEERHRTKIIPHAFGERLVLKLMWAAVIRAADWWRGIKPSARSSSGNCGRSAKNWTAPTRSGLPPSRG